MKAVHEAEAAFGNPGMGVARRSRWARPCPAWNQRMCVGGGLSESSSESILRTMWGPSLVAEFVFAQKRYSMKV